LSGVRSNGHGPKTSSATFNTFLGEIAPINKLILNKNQQLQLPSNNSEIVHFSSSVVQFGYDDIGRALKHFNKFNFNRFTLTTCALLSNMVTVAWVLNVKK
jgi:hypothetical protein